MSSIKVGPTIADDIKQNSYLAVLDHSSLFFYISYFVLENGNFH